METDALPLNTAFIAASALIICLFFLSCRSCFLMYFHSFLVSSVRGSGLAPTTRASLASGVTGAMNAAFGLRFVFFFFLTTFFFVAFFFAAFAPYVFAQDRYCNRLIAHFQSRESVCPECGKQTGRDA